VFSAAYQVERREDARKCRAGAGDPRLRRRVFQQKHFSPYSDLIGQVSQQHQIDACL
jgi:hypothetical protein